MDISKKIYCSASFLALKMAAIVHTGKKWAEPSVHVLSDKVHRRLSPFLPELRTVRLGRTVKAGRSSCSQWLEVKGW